MEDDMEEYPTVADMLSREVTTDVPDLVKRETEFHRAMQAELYDRAIDTVSDTLDLVTKRQKMLTDMMQKALWRRASSRAKRHETKLALADGERAVQLSPEKYSTQMEMYVLLMQLGHLTEADKVAKIALELSDRDAKRAHDAVYGGRPPKVAKSTHTFSLSSKLPKEILLQIFRQGLSLDVVGSVCQEWRKIVLNEPSMWRHLVMKDSATSSQCHDALSAYAERSHDSIEKVSFPTCLSEVSPNLMIAGLRQSAATLREIKLPLRSQLNCYENLYRHCPNLKVLELDVRVPELHETKKEELFPETGELPFQLEVYKCRGYLEYAIPFSRLKNLRVLHYHGPDFNLPDPMEHFNAMLALADSLEDLYINDIDRWEEFSHAASVTRTAARLPTITFPKLKRLMGWNITLSNHQKFVFPALEELIYLSCWEVTSNSRPHSTWPTFFKGSPHIRKLQFDALGANDEETDLLITLISRLDQLEDLEVRDEDDAYWGSDDGSEALQPVQGFEQILAPKYDWVAKEKAYKPRIPCPRLVRLKLECNQLVVASLVVVLALRHCLSKGNTFADAREDSERKYGLVYGWEWPEPSSIAHGTAPISQASASMTFDVCRLQKLIVESVPVVGRDADRIKRFADTVEASAKF